jgi:molybdopterin molybdotransferase
VISVDEALARIFHKLAAPAAETVPLARAHRRVLAAPLVATHNQPPFDSSAMDGYAVRAAEVAAGASLKLAGTSQAGARFIGMMERGQCVRIFTGAPLPIGADAVVMQEETRSEGNRITFIAAAKPGQNIRRQGSDFVRGTELLASGAVLTPAMLTAAASANYAEISVTKRPRLAILATGDELVPPGTPPGPDQIVASNSYGLVPLLAPYCDKVIDLGIVPDDKSKLEQALLGAFDYGVEVLVTTGGASVGERDYVREVLIDAFVTAMVIVRPALRQLTGHADPLWPRLTLPLAAPLAAGGERRHFRRASLQSNPLGMLEVLPIAEIDSSHVTSLAAADALIVQPENSLPLPAGELVEVIPLTWG